MVRRRMAAMMARIKELIREAGGGGGGWVVRGRMRVQSFVEAAYW